MRNASSIPGANVHRLARTLAPGPSPRSGSSLYPTVLRVPVADYHTFLTTVVARYEDTLKSFWPKAIVRSARAPHPIAVPNERLAEIIWHTLAAAMLTREIDDEAARAFAPIFREHPDATWLVCDVTCIKNARGAMLPGMYGAATRVLLQETGELPVVRAIELEGTLFRPGDGPAWELASLFVRQGISHAVVMASHPRNHFPYDTINGVTRKLLPADHLVRVLLEPHFYIHLALNYGVLYSNRSVARNSQSDIYTPFCTTEEGQFRLMRAGWKGMEGSPVWRPYRYPMSGYAAIGPFGDFCRHYDAVVRRHVHRALAGVDASEVHLLQWADEISAHLPGFPSAIRIAQPGVLQDAVASMIAGVSVVHSSEHYTYSQVPVAELPLRLRVPPPRGATSAAFRYEDLTSRRDMFRQHMAREMFFRVYPVKRLDEVEYAFHDREQQGLGERFRRELREASRRLPGREYVPLHLFASSLQY